MYIGRFDIPFCKNANIVGNFVQFRPQGQILSRKLILKSVAYIFLTRIRRLGGRFHATINSWKFVIILVIFPHIYRITFMFGNGIAMVTAFWLAIFVACRFLTLQLVWKLEIRESNGVNNFYARYKCIRIKWGVLWRHVTAQWCCSKEPKMATGWHNDDIILNSGCSFFACELYLLGVNSRTSKIYNKIHQAIFTKKTSVSKYRHAFWFFPYAVAA